MESGKLRHSVTIESPAGTSDGTGEVVAAWTLYCTTWASIEPLAAREGIRGAQIDVDQPFLIRMRYQSGILPSMRVKFGTRYFQIRSVTNVEERNRELSLLCVESF